MNNNPSDNQASATRKRKASDKQDKSAKKRKTWKFVDDVKANQQIQDQLQDWTVKPSVGELAYTPRKIANGTYTVIGPTVQTWQRHRPNDVRMSHAYFKVPTTAVPKPDQNSTTTTTVNDDAVFTQQVEPTQNNTPTAEGRDDVILAPVTPTQQVAPSVPDVIVDEQRSTPQKIVPDYTHSQRDLLSWNTPPEPYLRSSNGDIIPSLTSLMRKHLANLGNNISQTHDRESDIVFDKFILSALDTQQSYSYSAQLDQYAQPTDNRFR